MLKVRVIPTLLWKGLGLVKGVGFDSWRRVGPVLPAVKVYNARDVDELILLDINATLENEWPDHDSVNDFSEECAVPLTVGGGISSLEQVLDGADVFLGLSAQDRRQQCGLCRSRVDRCSRVTLWRAMRGCQYRRASPG